MGRQTTPRRGRVTLELAAVEAKQPTGRADPQKAVGGLGERADLTRSAILREPGRVVKLRKGSIAIERGRRPAREKADQAGPKHTENTKTCGSHAYQLPDQAFTPPRGPFACQTLLGDHAPAFGWH